MSAAVRVGVCKVKDLIQKQTFKVKWCLHTLTATDDIRRFPIPVWGCTTRPAGLYHFSSLFNAEATQPQDDGAYGITFTNKPSSESSATQPSKWTVAHSLVISI